MNNEQHNNWTTFWVIFGLVLMGGPFLIPLFSEETLKTTNFKVGYAVVAIILMLLAAFFCFPKMRVKTSAFFRRGVKSSIRFFVWFCGAVVRFSRNLGKMFLKEILFDDQHDRQKASSETTQINEEISILKERVEKLEKILYKNGVLLSSGMFLRNWDVAEAGDRQTLMINGVEFAFRYCPRGEFMMGSTDEEEGSKEQISEGFWICEVPTTQEQWEAVGCKKANECYFKGAKLPVESVTRYECNDFVEKLNEIGIAPCNWRFDFPTEEQWEYACRAGTTGSTCGIPLDDCAWYDHNSGKHTHDVGTKKANNWGILDMLGNVWEWVYPKNKRGGYWDCQRGGGWSDGALLCRPANGLTGILENNSNRLGFRCILVRSQSN